MVRANVRTANSVYSRIFFNTARGDTDRANPSRANVFLSSVFLSHREYWPAVRGAWAVSFFFWPLNYVTFRYLPLELRVLSVNVCDIVWTSVLSYCSHKVVPAATHAVELKIEVTSNMADRGGVFDSLSSALMADAESTGRGIGDGLAGICKWLRNSCRLVLANATF